MIVICKSASVIKGAYSFISMQTSVYLTTATCQHNGLNPFYPEFQNGDSN